ncbi:MAG: extracellular solute-binding protein [Clostridia bacterium]|nr:extracellular solute-binding protein [Clostridia bacterium]
MKKTVVTAAILVCAVLLSSCGIIISSESRIPAKTAAVTEKETATDAGTETPRDPGEFDTTSAEELKNDSEAALRSLTVVSASGTRLVVAATDASFLTGDGSETVLTSDRVERLQRVADKLHADIDVETFTESELKRRLSEAVSNGEYFADVLAVPRGMVGYLVSEGLVESLRTVPKFNIRADYFNADSVAAMTAGSDIFGAAGDGCFEPEKTYAVFFNKELARSLGLDLYGLVSDGKWTVEAYEDCVKKAAQAGKKPTVYSPSVNINEFLLYGSGFDFTVNATDKTPAPVTFYPSFSGLCETMAKMTKTPPSADAKGEFLKGEALFLIDTLNSAVEMSGSELVWGLVPSPKLDESSEYTSFAKDDAVVLCIPKNQGDIELSGDFIETLNAASYKYVKYDYLYYLFTKVLRDNGSVNSLQIILERENYDFVDIMRSGFPTLYNNTAGAFAEIISGTLTFDEYKTREKEVSEYLERWFPVRGM